MPPEKTLVLASLYHHSDDKEFESLLCAEGYSVTWFNSGAKTLNCLLANEPDLLILYGFVLQDMTNTDLAKQVNETFPNRKMRLMWMHQGNFVDDNDIKWNLEWLGGIDVFLPRYTPYKLLLPVFRKIKAMDAPGGT